jgi:hypothetical protein
MAPRPFQLCVAGMKLQHCTSRSSSGENGAGGSLRHRRTSCQVSSCACALLIRGISLIDHCRFKKINASLQRRVFRKVKSSYHFHLHRLMMPCLLPPFSSRRSTTGHPPKSAPQSKCIRALFCTESFTPSAGSVRLPFVSSVSALTTIAPPAFLALRDATRRCRFMSPRVCFLAWALRAQCCVLSDCTGCATVCRVLGRCCSGDGDGFARIYFVSALWAAAPCDSYQVLALECERLRSTGCTAGLAEAVSDMSQAFFSAADMHASLGHMPMASSM